MGWTDDMVSCRSSHWLGSTSKHGSGYVGFLQRPSTTTTTMTSSYSLLLLWLSSWTECRSVALKSLNRSPVVFYWISQRTPILCKCWGWLLSFWYHFFTWENVRVTIAYCGCALVRVGWLTVVQNSVNTAIETLDIFNQNAQNKLYLIYWEFYGFSEYTAGCYPEQQPVPVPDPLEPRYSDRLAQYLQYILLARCSG